ncbi:hypothetical protein LWI28_010731 [Acer negundo]|uniref:Uncharacterized protein n=1 Tax=Acer negundo TaxID=4023 RepID=A0AAD5JKN1_ACENE|nr:hypothetical protein LWI28_010731 [Acer negundo]
MHTMFDPCNSRASRDLSVPKDVEGLLPLGSRKRQRQTPSWASAIIQGQKDQQAQIAELIRVLQTSTLTASERHEGAGPSSEPQQQQQDEETPPKDTTH